MKMRMRMRTRAVLRSCPPGEVWPGSPPGARSSPGALAINSGLSLGSSLLRRCREQGFGPTKQKEEPSGEIRELRLRDLRRGEPEVGTRRKIVTFAGVQNRHRPPGAVFM